MNSVERRIRTLAQVQGLELTPINLWTVAFKDFSETATRYENVFYKREEEMRSVKNEIYQVVGFFSAFQGLLITAAAQSNLLRCNNVGFILALSAFATAVAVFGILQKITAMEDLRDNKNFIEKLVEAYHGWVDDLQTSGIRFQLDSFTEPPNNRRSSCKAILVAILVWYGIALHVSVIAFGALCAVAMHQIVCNPGHSLPSN
jgi:hypothetical protein